MTIQGFFLGLHPVPDRPIQPLKWYFPLCFSTVVFASALRSGKARLLCTIPIAALFSRFHSCYSGIPKEDYQLSLWLMWIFLRYIDISVLGPDDKMWKTRTQQMAPTSKDGSKEKANERVFLRSGSFTSRLKRSFSLWTTLRGLGWNWEIEHMKKHRGSRT
jgi:hypothetical protein